MKLSTLTAPLLVAATIACHDVPSPAKPFVIAAPYDVTSLDPGASNTVSNFSVLSNVYEPLVTLDADLTIAPCLAQPWENPDPLTWIFHLRPQVSFHSGRALTSADVVSTFQRILESDTLEMRTYVLAVREVVAIDRATVRIRTERPLRMLLNKLHFVLIVPATATPDSLASGADGTGPYRLVSRGPDMIVLARNERYWGARPALQDVRFAISRTQSEVIAGAQGGRYQLAQADAETLERGIAGSDHLALLRHESLYLKFAGYDVASETSPFHNVGVRQALNLALDRVAFAAGLPNHATPASQPIPRFVFGFDPELPVPRQDLGRARALLAQAGFAGGFAATLDVRRMFGAAAVLLQQQLAPLGVRLEIRTQDDAAFFAAQTRMAQSLWLTRSGCPTGDAGDILDSVIHSADPVRRLGSRNYGGFADPQMDAAIEAAAQIEKMSDRRAAVQAIMARSMEILPILPLYFDEDAYALDRAYSWRPRNDSYLRAAEITPR